MSLVLDLVEETLSIGERALVLLRPRSSEALIDEEAFEHEEFLPYWAEPWPSGLALARVVSARDVRGLAVLELGCGLALPSLAAALGGARVLATDWSPDAVALARLNAARNGAAVETAVCSWTDAARLAARGPWELVLAADVLYERRNGAALLELLPRLVDARGEVLVADPGRPPAPAFLAAAARAWRVASSRDPLAPTIAIHALRKRQG